MVLRFPSSPLIYLSARTDMLNVVRFLPVTEAKDHESASHAGIH